MQMLTGMEYLKAEIACLYDKKMEKKTWNERLAFFEEMQSYDKVSIRKASNPIGLRAAIDAYKKAKNGEPSGYMISLDACSSGLQFLSLLVSCPTSFDLCGGRNDTCESAYRVIYDAMGLNGELSQAEVKNTIMTALYGSTSIPEGTFGENIDLFYETMEDQAPGAWQLNLDLQDLWTRIKGSTYDWILPDNFHACIDTDIKIKIPFEFLDTPYEITRVVEGRPDFHKGLGPNLTHSVDGFAVREMFRRCMFNPKIKHRVEMALISQNQGTTGRSAPMVQQLWDHYLESGFLSVRILDYIYEDTIGLVALKEILDMIESLPAKPFELVSVHDCFRCHPNYGNDLRIQYNTIMADVNDSQLLRSLARQVTKSKLNTRKMGTIDRNVILNADYILA